MLYSLTDKLQFEEKPQIEINGVILTINDDAENVLKLMDVVENEGEIAGAKKAVELLFSKADQKKLDGLHLTMANYSAVISASMQLAVGANPDEEESGE